jgi:hypothetical protein
MLIMASVVGLSMVGSQFAGKLNLADQLMQAEREKQQLREQKEQLTKANEQLTEHNQKLAMANKLLKTDYQLARLRLKKQEFKGDPNKIVSVVEFWQVDDEGNPITQPQEYRLHGDKVHVDGLIAKFDDELVEKADPLRGAAMFAFKSIYGNRDAPEDGYPIPGKRGQPNAYNKGGLPSEFEEGMWRNFWELAHDKQAMEKLGLRAAHGQGVFQKLQEGLDYEVRLRSTGECTIKPLFPNPGTSNSHAKLKSWQTD